MRHFKSELGIQPCIRIQIMYSRYLYLWEVKIYVKIEMVNFIVIPYAFRDGPMDLIFYMQMTKNTVAIFAPMINMAPCVMLLTWAASITRASRSGLDPGNHCCGSGSGIRCLLDPWIRDSDPWSGMGKKSGSGSEMNNPDHISESLKNYFLGLKYLKYLMWIRDRKKRIQDGKKSDTGYTSRIRNTAENRDCPLKWHRADPLFWAQMALASLVAISGPKKISISRVQPPSHLPS